MEDLESKVSISLGKDIEVLLYVDDIYVGVFGKSREDKEQNGGWVQRVHEVMWEVPRE